MTPRNAGRNPGKMLAAATLLLALPGCDRGAAPAQGAAARPERLVPVEVAAVERRPVTYAIETVGSIEADEVIRIPARVAGVVQDIAFREGAEVVAGTVLARIDPERYRLVHARAAAAAAEAKAQLKDAEAAFARRQALSEKDLVSEEELLSATARVEERRAALAATEAQLALAAKDLRDSEVRAEAPGIVNEKLVDTGAQMDPGDPIATIVDTRRLKLAFHVAETESARLGEAREVRFRVRSLPGREFRARIYHTGRAAEAGTRRVKCVAWVEDGAAELRPGFFADVTVVVETRDSVVVPASATLPSDKGFVAWVVGAEGTAEERPVVLGLRTRDGMVEVLEGLAAGESLVVRGGAALRPGAKVKVVAPDGAGGSAKASRPGAAEAVAGGGR